MKRSPIRITNLRRAFTRAPLPTVALTFISVELRKISRIELIVIEQVPLSVAGQALSLTKHRVVQAFREKFRLRLLCDPHATDGSPHAVMAAIATSLRTLSRLWRNEIGITLPQWRTQLRRFHALHLQAARLSITTVASRCG